jgi:hypothetical protein
MGNRLRILADARLNDAERVAVRLAMGHEGLAYSARSSGMTVTAGDGLQRPIVTKVSSSAMARDVVRRFMWWTDPQRMGGQPAWRILRHAIEEHTWAVAAQRRRRFGRSTV